MMHLKFCLPGLLSLVLLALGACARVAPAPQLAQIAPDAARMLAAIDAAAAADVSVIEVTPLVDPGVAMLRQQARSAAITGAFDDAMAKLDRALALDPGAPEILQEKAEVALRAGDYDRAESLALEAFESGPRLGPICARNWQTVLELRNTRHDDAGAAAARDALARCQKPRIERY